MNLSYLRRGVVNSIGSTFDKCNKNCRFKHTVVFLRHGESVWNDENKFTGWYDCELSEKGNKEAIEGM